MNIKNMQEALNILIPHYTDPNIKFLSAEHDSIYFPPTNTPLNDEERVKLKNIMVFQEDVETGEKGVEYDPEQGWVAFT